MHSFKDKKDREWRIELTIGAAKRVKESLGINLLEPEQGEPPLITRLGTDEILLVDTVFALLKPAADELSVSDEDFGSSLDGAAALAMQTAFYLELIDFFRSRGRSDRSKAAELQQKMITETIKVIEQKLNQVDVDGELNKIFGSSSGSSQA